MVVSSKTLTTQDNRGVYKQYQLNESAFVPQIKMHINGKFKTLRGENSLQKVPKLIQVTPEDKKQLFSYIPAPVLGPQERLGYNMAKGYQRYQNELADAQAYKEYLGARTLQDAKYASPSIERMASDISREQLLSHRHIVGENSQNTVNVAPGMAPIGSSRGNGLSVNTHTANLYNTSSATPDTANRRHGSLMDISPMRTPDTARTPRQRVYPMDTSADISGDILAAGEKRSSEDDRPAKRRKIMKNTVNLDRSERNDIMARDRPRNRSHQPQLNELRSMERTSRMSNLANRPGTAAEGNRARQRLEQYRRDNNLPPGGRHLGRYNDGDDGYIPINTRFSY